MTKRKIDLRDIEITEDGTMLANAFIPLKKDEVGCFDPSEVYIKSSDLPKLARNLRKNGEIELAERMEKNYEESIAQKNKPGKREGWQH